MEAWKQVFEKAFSESQPRTKEEVDELVDQVNQAGSAMARKHGYSPMQHVFGCELKFPGITGEDAAYAPGTRQYHAGDECARASAMRPAVRKAFVELDEGEKVRRAVQHRKREKDYFEVVLLETSA